MIFHTNASLDGTCKTTSDYEADFDTLKSQTTVVRTYSVVDGAIDNTPCQVASAILPAAANKGFQVILGVWYETIYQPRRVGSLETGPLYHADSVLLGLIPTHRSRLIGML